MLFLSIYLTIAAIAFFVLLDILRDEREFSGFVTDYGVFMVILASLVVAFLWPAILLGVLFDLAEKKT